VQKFQSKLDENHFVPHCVFEFHRTHDVVRSFIDTLYNFLLCGVFTRTIEELNFFLVLSGGVILVDR
jgi:hypothetical protein